MYNKIKNVAIVCHDHMLSGANRSLLDWLKTATNYKYNIICVIPRKGAEFEKICIENGIEVIRGYYFATTKHLYKLSVKENIKNIIKNALRICINPISFKILQYKFKKRKIDLIHSNSFATTFGIKLALKMQIPHIWHIREFMQEDHRIEHFEKQKKIEEYCKNSSAIFISDVIKNKYYNMFSNNVTKVIYDKVEFDKKYEKKRQLLEDGKCNMLIAGTLSSNKNQIEAIRIVEELIKRRYKNILLYICGIGDNEQYLKDYVKKNKLSNYVRFMGQVNNLTEFRKNIDIAFVCSKSEALGRVTIEAMYYKNIIVGGNVGCTPYLIDNNKTGILYECGNYKDAADKVVNIINNKTDYNKLIENAQEVALKKYYDIDYAREIFEVYEEAMKGIEL